MSERYGEQFERAVSFLRHFVDGSRGFELTVKLDEEFSVATDGDSDGLQIYLYGNETVVFTNPEVSDAENVAAFRAEYVRLSGELQAVVDRHDRHQRLRKLVGAATDAEFVENADGTVVVTFRPGDAR